MTRAWLAAAASLLLAACAGTPPRSPAPAAPAPVVTRPIPAGTAPPRVVTRPAASPYSPATEDTSKRGQMVGDLYRPDLKDSVPDFIPDVERIPEPVVRDEPRSRRGNRDYAVLGQQYRVLADRSGYVEEGLASYYGNKFHRRQTSSGEVYDMYAFSAAHRTLPLPSFARVTNLANGRSVVVRVNDRGPFHGERLIDLSYAAAVKLGYREQGTARVRVQALTPEETTATQQVLAQAQAARTDPAAREALLLQMANGQVPAGVALANGPNAANREYRFDMTQDGKPMTAAEFEEWMRVRQLRVATGRPGAPLPAAAAVPVPSVVPAVTPDMTPAAAAPVVVAPPPAAVAAEHVTLQVAAFASEDNARQAREMLRGAGMPNAALVPGLSGLQMIWRLRVPAAMAEVPALSERIRALGFGPPATARD